ncbi:hypothetical protein Droror1_Dr00002364, partial [Drosera rotundifolia]
MGVEEREDNGGRTRGSHGGMRGGRWVMAEGVGKAVGEKEGGEEVRGRDDGDGESEDDLGWLDGPDNDVEAEKFAQKVGSEIGFGVELSSIVTRIAVELKNGLVSCASECPVGFPRVEASK